MAQAWERRFSRLKPLPNALGYETYLLVELNKGRFKEILSILSDVTWILHVTQTFAQFGFFRHEFFFNLSWEGVQWHSNVFRVSDLFELDVRDLLVTDDCGIVSWHIAW